MRAIEIGPLLTNQIKFTPYNEQFSNLKVAIKYDKIITAYSPLARGGIANDVNLQKIGEKYGKTASQVTLRWLIQLKNVSVIPKASTEKHQKENLDIFDFELSGEDMEKIRELSKRPAWK
jgi:diketogulonate reductase-like aldo/keto reductase